MLQSCLCTQAQLQSDIFQAWAARLGERPMRMHRKVWEFCYIAQALHERGMLAPGRRGLGFGVGQEPLPALFAGLGCEVVATDTDLAEAQAGGWVKEGMYAGSLARLSRPGLCDPLAFGVLVTFRVVDMRRLPSAGDLGEFDFVWSACSLEHLGSLAAGEEFLFGSLRYLKPGGVAVHTTEYNVGSNTATVTTGQSNIYRKKDLQRIAAKLRRRGYSVERFDWSEGSLPCDDRRIAEPYPWKGDVHLKLLLEGFVATSVGLIVRRPA